MGPTLMYSCFLSGATLALYHGSPLGHGFGKFVQVMWTSVPAKETIESTWWKGKYCIGKRV